MQSKRFLIVGMTAFLIFAGAKVVFSQEQADTVVETQNTIVEGSAVAQDKEPEMQWIYGDVINLDPHNKIIMVKTLDYETDQEKEIAIAIDEKTTFENIKSLDEIRPNDTVSIDYIVTADGKNLARNISLETSEAQVIPETIGVEQQQMQTAPATESPKTTTTVETTQPPEAPSSGKATGQ